MNSCTSSVSQNYHKINDVSAWSMQGNRRRSEDVISLKVECIKQLNTRRLKTTIKISGGGASQSDNIYSTVKKLIKA